MLDFRIDTFLAVCQFMNFTKAAEHLGITQPAVSQHIRHLEQEYEIKLFSFHGKKMRLTEAGSLLLSVSQTRKHDEYYLKKLLKNGDSRNRTLRFGATLTVGEFIIPQKVADYLKRHQETALTMLVANTSELLLQLNEGQIDFAIVEGYFQKSDYDHRIFSREPYVAVCAPGHVFHSIVSRMEDLFEETLIIRELGSGTRDILEKALERRNYGLGDFKTVVEVGNLNAIKHLVQADCGITFLYQAAADEELKKGALQLIPLGSSPLLHDITFIWRKESVFASHYEELFQELQR